MIINAPSLIPALVVLVAVITSLVQHSQGAWTLPHQMIKNHRTSICMGITDRNGQADTFSSEFCAVLDTRTQVVRRRRLLQSFTWVTLLPTFWAKSSVFLPPIANAQEPSLTTTCVSSPDGSTSACAASLTVTPLSAEQVAEWLHGVPTFTLVDTEGVPYMVVGEDAQVTGYFFPSFDEAKRILQVARKSADKSIKEAASKAQRESKVAQEESIGNPWNDARISTVPLDVAVTLVTKSTKGNIFLLAPSASDIEEALQISGLGDLSEEKVPLFYMKDFTNSEGKSPLYFTKSQLLQDYRKANNKPPIPPVLVTELFAVLGQMVQGGNADVQNLVLVPPVNSLQHAKECIQQGGKQPPFVLGQRNVVL